MGETTLKLTPETAFEIASRRRWLILVPLSIVLIFGIPLAIFMPRIYEAKTLIIVESQRVPQNYVQSIVTEDPAQRINTISQQIMSRTNLEKVIRNFNLFPDQQKSGIFMEDMVANLRSKISVEVIRGGRETNAFAVSYKGRDPQTVMRVANGLAAYFIDENLKVRELQAIGTSVFLEAELESMRKKLEILEEGIKEYRKTNMGELPEQLDTNLRILERLQADLGNRQQNLREAKIRLAELKNMTGNREPSILVIGGPQRANEPTASLEQLRLQLESLQSRYTDRHPDIQRIQKQIAELEAKSGEGEAGDADLRHIPLEFRRQMLDVQREIQVADSEINNLRLQIALYQKRVENIPKREQELLSLNRDYQNIRTTYQSLLNRKLEAEIAVNMERKQQGEQFRIIDPARLPERPVEPNMKKLSLLILAVGLGGGLGLALLLEIKNPSYRTPDEIETQYGLPVLVSIPKLMLPRQILLSRLNKMASISYSVFVLCLLGFLGVITIRGADFAMDALKQITGI